MKWHGISNISPKKYTCGFCNAFVASNAGYIDMRDPGHNYITVCSNCACPTFFSSGKQTPGVAAGSPVKHAPDDIEALYEEARKSVSVSAYTGSVLICRKLLMNIAVNQGAQEGLKFIEYVDYLADKGYVPPNGKAWVDHIRKKGNEATHEIVLMSNSDALELVSFVEMLLKFIYEFPAKVPKPS